MKTQKQKGFTLTEVLIGIFILSIVIFGVFGMYDYSLKIVRDKARREEAIAIANQEMENFRSVDYDDLGPYLCSLGQTSDTKTVVRNGINYEVVTHVICTDDPFDNEDHDPLKDDLEAGFNDYKTVRVEVRWDSTFSNNSVIFVTTFAPIGIETDCGGGILKVNVFDANVQPISGASVYIKNDNIGYEFDTKTNNNGIVRMGCLTEDLNNHYEITVNKPGAIFYQNTYSSAQTCPTGVGVPNPICPKTSIDNANPNPPHVNIGDGETTEISFSVDLLSVLNITTIAQDLPIEWTANESTGDGFTQEMPTIAIGPSDVYYLFWQGDDGGQTRIYAQKYDSSQAAQWPSAASPEDVQVTTANDEIFPFTTVGMTSGDVYIAWYHAGSGNQEAYVEKLASANGSIVWGVDLNVCSTNNNDDQTEPQIGLEDDENFFYLTYLDNSYDTNDLYTARFATLDGSQEDCDEFEVRMNDDGDGNTQASQSILVEPVTDDLVAVWHDNRDGDYDIYAQKINSYGDYSNEIQISVESDTSADTTSLNGLLAGTLIYRDPNSGASDDSFIFIDEGNGLYDGTEIQISVESDTHNNTTSLNGPLVGTLIYKDPGAGVSDDSYVFVDANGNENYNNGEIKINVESDTIADTTSFNGTVNGSFVYFDPDPIASNDSYIFADANGNSARDTWGANIKINEDGGEDQKNPDVDILQDAGENFLYFVWQDERNGNYDIYVAKYDINGIRLWTNDVNLSTKDTTSSDQTKPVIAVNNANDAIYVAWVDERNGNPDIYMQKFDTLGVAEWDDDYRVNDDQTFGSTQDMPQILINSSDDPVITWQDNDSGDYDIMVSIIPDPEPANKANVPLRIYGSKTIGRDANGNDIYKFDKIVTTDTSGELKFDGIDEPKLEWDAYTLEIDGGDYELIRSEPPMPIVINPNTTRDIILNVAGNVILQIDFSSYAVGSYGGAEDVSATVSIENDGDRLRITGNGWKMIPLPYEVTADTILEFDFQSDVEGEVHGIGFDDDLNTSSDKTFELYGTQDWGYLDYKNYESFAPTIRHYVIYVGEKFTGQMQYLFFVMDDDAQTAGEIIFSNVEIYEEL